jgi:methylated-DNA-[protein]-cysteine S-methyltransferase
VDERSVTGIETARLESPIGAVRLAVRAERLCALGFAEHWPRLEHALGRRFVGLELRDAEDPAGIVTRLRAYFAGDLSALDSIPVDLAGTPFQRRVWGRLREIPCGRTLSYRDLAAAIGAPSSVRAVGAANGANPASIVIPCHRVIGANGDLVGCGGGIGRKSWLLNHEGARLLP